MKIIVASTNQAKIHRLQKLCPDDVELLPLSHYFDGAEASENLGSAPYISAEKALQYLEKIGENYPLLTQDDTLFISSLNEQDQPGRSIKQPVISKFGTFNTKNAVEYYTKIAARHGGSIPIEFRYGHTLVSRHTYGDGRNGFVSFTAESTLKGMLVDRAKNLNDFTDYFLAAIMTCEIAGEQKYYSELTDDELVTVDADIAHSLHALLKMHRSITE